MNIFILDYNPMQNVKYYFDSHVVKMVTETAQILSSAYYFTGEEDLAQYKLTHKNHPCCRWARENISNWRYLYILGLCIYSEYQYRYEKEHKSGEVLLKMEFPTLPKGLITELPKCMPEEYQCDSVVESYRKYYIYGKKENLRKWKNREKPEWFK